MLREAVAANTSALTEERDVDPQGEGSRNGAIGPSELHLDLYGGCARVGR